MTATILAQTPDNGIYRVGYQWQVWFNGQSACYSSKSRAQAELARLQQYEAPQQQALSLLNTLYHQYDAMAEQYESLAAYIKTTFSLEKLNKVIDQLTADLLAVSECHPQMVQQAQAQAVGASMEAAIIESRETAGDSDLTAPDSKSPALSPEDIRFDHHYTTKNTINVYTFDEKLGRIERGQLHFTTPDGDSQFIVNGEVIISFDKTDNYQTLSTKIAAYLNGEMRPQQVQQAQAQAVDGLTLGEQISRIIATSTGDSDLTTSDKSPAEYAEMHRNGLLSESELFRLCPLAIPYVAKRTAWMAVDPRADYSNKTATDQFGNTYRKSANLITVTLVNGQEGGGETAEDALNCALTTPFYTQAELAQFGEMAEASGHAPAAADSDEIEIEWTRDAQGESDGYQFDCHKGLDADGNSYYRTTSEQPTGEPGMIMLVRLVKATLPDGREGQAETAEAALAIAKAKPSQILPSLVSLQGEIAKDLFYAKSGSLVEKFCKKSLEKIAALMDELDGNPAPDSGLTLGDFVEANDEYPRPIVSLFPDDEDFCHPDSLGDLWHAQQVQQAQVRHRAYPPTPKPNDLGYVVTSVEANIFTLQAPADSHIAKVLQAYLIVHEAIEYLEPCGYSLVARLKADFGFFATPKTLAKKITQTLASLKEAKSSGLSVADFDDVPFTAQQEAMDNVGFIWSVIKNLEALA